MIYKLVVYLEVCTVWIFVGFRLFVDPFSVDSIKTGLIEALDESNFSIYRQKGLIQAENFNWDISANKIWNVIELELKNR